MGLPLAPIALSLAAAGLKMYGGHGELVGFIQHPLDLLAGHASARTVEDLGERLRGWAAGTRPPDNLELERAIARCALLADLFCFCEGIDRTLGHAAPLGRIQQLCGDLLGRRPSGILSQAEQQTTHRAVEATLARLDELDKRGPETTGIDPTQLVSWSQPATYAVDLAARALAAAEGTHGAMPARVRSAFAERWFGYLCLTFHGEIKTNPRVSRIFQALQTATGFARLEGVVREEGERTRQVLSDEIRSLRGSRNASFKYVLPARGLVVGREHEIEIGLRAWMADRSRPLLIWGPPGIGKSTLALSLLHESSSAEQFGDRRFLIRCDGHTSVESLQLAMGSEWFGLSASPQIAGEVLAKLAEAPAAIVVDNFETTHRGATQESEAWLRRMLGLPGAWLIVGVQGHETPGGIHWNRPLEPSRLTLDQSRVLFREVCGIDVTSTDVLDRLLGDLDGVPHAIELLASQATSDPDLPRLAARWIRERTNLLRRGIGATRETSIAISYEFAIGSPWLTNAGRRLLRVLANLPLGIAMEDVPKTTDRPDDSNPLEAAAELMRSSLVFTEADRMRMLAPLRDHVLSAHPGLANELRSIRDAFLTLAILGQQVGTAGGGSVLRTLTREYLNCQWAVGLALDSSDDASVPAALGLGQFSRFSGVGDSHMVDRAREFAHSRRDRLGEADCIQSLGDIAQARSDHAEAQKRYDVALELFRSLPEPNSIGWTLRRLARLETEPSRKREMIREIVECWTTIDRQDLIEDLRREFPDEVSRT